MASTSFRDSINSMGWSRRDVDIPVNTSAQNPLLSRLQSLNPFGSSGYVSLPTQEPGAPLPAPSRREEDEGIFAREYCGKKRLQPLQLSLHKVAGDKMGEFLRIRFCHTLSIMHLPFLVLVCNRAGNTATYIRT